MSRDSYTASYLSDAAWIIAQPCRSPDCYICNWLDLLDTSTPDVDRTPRGEPLAPLPDWLKKVDGILKDSK